MLNTSDISIININNLASIAIESKIVNCSEISIGDYDDQIALMGLSMASSKTITINGFNGSVDISFSSDISIINARLDRIQLSNSISVNIQNVEAFQTYIYCSSEIIIYNSTMRVSFVSQLAKNISMTYLDLTTQLDFRESENIQLHNITAHNISQTIIKLYNISGIVDIFYLELSNISASGCFIVEISSSSISRLLVTDIDINTATLVDFSGGGGIYINNTKIERSIISDTKLVYLSQNIFDNALKIFNLTGHMIISHCFFSVKETALLINSSSLIEIYDTYLRGFNTLIITQSSIYICRSGVVVYNAGYVFGPTAIGAVDSLIRIEETGFSASFINDSKCILAKNTTIIMESSTVKYFYLGLSVVGDHNVDVLINNVSIILTQANMYSAIEITSVVNVVINNVTIQNTYTAIKIVDCYDLIISETNIYSARYGIIVEYSLNVEASNFCIEVSEDGVGINCSSTENVTIYSGNIYLKTSNSTGWQYGISIEKIPILGLISNVEIRAESSSTKKVGIYTYNSTLSISNCIIIGPMDTIFEYDFGIIIGPTSNVTINQSDIKHWYWGYFANTSMSITVLVDNRIHNCTVGVYTLDSDIIYANVFVNNTLDAFTNVTNPSFYNGEICIGNYWANYIGVDADGDGIGDDVHKVQDDPSLGLINNGAMDPYPLVLIPDRTDYDNDGITTHDEFVLYGTSPTMNDTDGDGIMDSTEIFTYGSNPKSGDTDGDGLPDAWEAYYSTNITWPSATMDPDGDNLTNIEEYHHNTNPNMFDTDSDTLSDYDEVYVYGTNATNPDNDNDGILDGWEILYGFNISDPSDALSDPDGDNLTNIGEFCHDTDPLVKDTDGDGMWDGWEVVYHLDPNNSSDAQQDFDKDGITNYWEFLNKTNPLSDDTDGDGMWDGWEIEHNFDPLSNDSYMDPDGDNLTNFGEFIFDSDPYDPDTDGDMLPDGYEVEYNFDPKYNDSYMDSDGDGLTNLEEYNIGTNPRMFDSDGDGLSDGYEYRMGLDPLNPDTDGDGYSDGEEISRNSDPRNAFLSPITVLLIIVGLSGLAIFVGIMMLIKYKTKRGGDADK